MSTSTRPSSQTPGDILLDAGTNELEVLVFGLAEGTFGVNVAKVREVIRSQTLSGGAHAHSSVLGMFNMRGEVIPLVDLAAHLGIRGRGEAGEDARIIVMEFNGRRSGYMVDKVEQIHRLGWDLVEPAPALQFGKGAGKTDAPIACTGIIKHQSRLIQMIDFESVADAIVCDQRLHFESVKNTMGVERSGQRVILVEDSAFMRGVIRDIFTNSGYDAIEVYENGLAAWEAIEASLTNGRPIRAVVSDIEMPRIDGLHLCKRIKSTPGLASTPVILFSSLITDDNLKKGEQVGANAQVAKPDLEGMVVSVDRALKGELAKSA